MFTISTVSAGSMFVVPSDPTAVDTPYLYIVRVSPPVASSSLCTPATVNSRLWSDPLNTTSPAASAVMVKRNTVIVAATNVPDGVAPPAQPAVHRAKVGFVFTRVGALKLDWSIGVGAPAEDTTALEPESTPIPLMTVAEPSMAPATSLR